MLQQHASLPHGFHSSARPLVVTKRHSPTAAVLRLELRGAKRRKRPAQWPRSQMCWASKHLRLRTEGTAEEDPPHGIMWRCGTVYSHSGTGALEQIKSQHDIKKLLLVQFSRPKVMPSSQ